MIAGIDDVSVAEKALCHLGASPPYQAGPLGRYYLPTSSPLYNTDKRGSRPVAEAGLFHYTTRADQTRDGDQADNAIIGRHYVATAPLNPCPAPLSLIVAHNCFDPYYCGNLAFWLSDGWNILASGMLGPGQSTQVTFSATVGASYNFGAQNNSYDYALDFAPTLQDGAIDVASDGTLVVRTR